MELKGILDSLSGCSCGRDHRVKTPEIIIEKGLVSRVGVLLRDDGLLASTCQQKHPRGRKRVSND